MEYICTLPEKAKKKDCSGCEHCGYAEIDIDTAISQKHEYNKSRPYRHGGKKC